MPTVHSKQEELVWDGMHETEAKFQELLDCCQIDEYMRPLTDYEVLWMKKVSDDMIRQNVYDRGDNVFRYIIRETHIRDHEELKANLYDHIIGNHTVEIKQNKLMIIIWRHIHNGNKVKALEKIKKVQVIQLKSLEQLEEGKISYGVLSTRDVIGHQPRVVYRGKAGLDENVRRYGETLRLERIQLDNWMRLTC